MLTEIQKWLSNPKRKYADGLNYFNRFASKKQKESFGAFLNDVDNDTVHQFGGSGQFPILINQVVFVLQRIKTNPDLFKESMVKPQPVKRQEAARISEATSLSDIPDQFDAEKKRLKEIVPLMARIHADMSVDSLADDKRAVLRSDLITLDDERRAIWQKIDTGAGTPEKSEEEKTVEKNMLELGRKSAQRIGSLRSYIRRNEDALKKHSAVGNKKKADNARIKIEEYKKELKELEAMFPEDEK
jgi:hypothetical protein